MVDGDKYRAWGRSVGLFSESLCLLGRNFQWYVRSFVCVYNTIYHAIFYSFYGDCALALFLISIISPSLSTGLIHTLAIAAGMMIAASYSLLYEGCKFDDPHDTSMIPIEYRTGMGAALGLIFIVATEKFLAKYDDLTVGGLDGADAKRALLIFFVMTLHSFSEGVGIGVSFGGVHGSELGVFISASLAVHNIPEGLAMAVTLMPRGTSLLTAIVWAVMTSIPQPLMAVPAYEFVHHFIPILPVGLGFAGGAMAWVALFELMKEAIEDSGLVTTACVSLVSLTGMHFLQEAIDTGARA
jgi:ZIP family zinc transporter